MGVRPEIPWPRPSEPIAEEYIELPDRQKIPSTSRPMADRGEPSKPGALYVLAALVTIATGALSVAAYMDWL